MNKQKTNNVDHWLYMICWFWKEPGWLWKEPFVSKLGWAQLLVVLAFAVCLELVIDRLFCVLCFFFLVVPNRIIFSSIESIVDAIGLERSRYQINWDLSPCSVDPPQHYLFTGRSLLSGRRVGKRAVNHPRFVLRTDLCFEWLIDALIQGLENWSEATRNYGNIDVSSVK